jgi:hypothetical protein
VPATPPAAIAATTALAAAATPDGPTASASAAAPQAALVGPSLPATGRESAAASAASWSPPADAAPPAVNAQAPTGARPAAPIPAAQPGGPAPARPYRPLAHTKLYLARPTNDNDGLGTTWGVRAKLADPLAKHQFTLEGSYGYKSERGQYAVEYLNDQTPLHLGVRFAKQVPALRGERDALVAETTEGAELLAELPLTLSRNAYAKDRLSFGFEALDHRPFATAGGALYPPPQPTLVTAPSVALRRTQLLPGRGDQEVSAKLTRADRFWGGDLAFTSAKLSYTTRRWAPSPRQVARVGGALQWFDGQDYSRTQVTQTLGTGELGYQCRVADQVLSRYTWPYVHVGPVYFDASYQTRAGISGQTRGLDLRDRFRAEMLNSGYLSRNFAYDLKAGQTTYIERGRAPVDWYLQVTFKMRDLPF